MKFADDKAAPTTAESLRSLFSVSEEHKTNTIILQCPTANLADVNFGTSSKQPGFIAPGGNAELGQSSLNDVHVKGNGADLLILLVL